MALDKAETLRGIPLFASLSPAELNALAKRGVEKRYEAGDVLFREGEECAGLFVLVSGSVKIFKTSAGGREIIPRLPRRGVRYFPAAPFRWSAPFPTYALLTPTLRLAPFPA